MPFETDVRKLLTERLKLDEIPLEKPKPEFGDLAFPCFILAKEWKKSPVEIARQLATELEPEGDIRRIEANGPYLNFYMEKGDYAKDVLAEIRKKGKNYGSSGEGKGRKMLIEHTSINPNASPHVGRARNAIIGDCIARVMKFQGYKVKRHFYVNDVGKQIAMLVMAAKKKPSFSSLLTLYIKVNEEIKIQPEKEKEVFELLRNLEEGDVAVKKKFRQVVDICIEGQSAILKDFGITYDFFDYESDYLWNRQTKHVLRELEKTEKLFTDEHNRQVLDQEGFGLSMKTPVFVLTRGDGTSLYGLRDIAYNFDKMRQAKKNLVVLGEDQKLYFQQIKAALEMLGHEAPEVIHYSFVLLAGEKMSTRKGSVVLLEDFMSEAKEKAAKEILERGYSKNVKKMAKVIGYGAIKYAILKVSADKNVHFDWTTALSFEGETGPYIQYAHARICSILRKHGKKLPDCDASVLISREETELLKRLGEFPEIVKEAERKPQVLTSYIYNVARQFSDFYHNHPVLKAKEQKRDARLQLCSAVKQVLATGLDLTGIEAPERM
ncbi:MAG: arginine--tRNA ligase [Nanoarchaeota archaeon]|nr:arginine--tRNA ligase [Nanoarchaeota archaeon]